MVEIGVDGRALQLRQQVTIVIEVVANRALAVLVQAGALAEVENGCARARLRVVAACVTDRIDLEFTGAVDQFVLTQAVAAADAGHDVELPVKRVRAVVPEDRAGGIRRAGVETITEIRVGPARVVL